MVEQYSPVDEPEVAQLPISVAAAEAEFARLTRTFTQKSKSSNLDTTCTKEGVGHHDVELGATPSDEAAFSLEQVLRGRLPPKEKYPREAGVIWDNLHVVAPVEAEKPVATVGSSLLSLLNPKTIGHLLKGKAPNLVDKVILNNFNGVAKPGEMVLVLGRPGSGCSTFLKTVTLQAPDGLKINGDMLYSHMDPSTFAKRFRGEVVYNQEDDVHYPTLTVGQTLDFAIETKVPPRLPSGVSKAEFKQMVLGTLLKMFNMEQTLHTQVGNETIRGVSGGEKKRLSIAEMMVTSAAICAWDNSTRGLDAGNALDFARSLRIVTNIYRTVTFACLYQVSEDIYEQFDKVLVISEGRQVFWGPAKSAVAYFQGLGYQRQPGQDSADFLCSCTDAAEQDQTPLQTEESRTASALESLFNESPLGRSAREEMTVYYQQVREEQNNSSLLPPTVNNPKQISNQSVYTIPYHRQVWILLRRQFLIRFQDRLSLVMSTVTTLAVALMFGSLWFQQPETPNGAFTRTGLLFLCLVYNGFRSFAQISIALLSRRIVNKHRDYAFHRMSALWTAQIFVDATFIFSDLLIYTTIIYFMCGLALVPAGYFIFLLTTWMSFLAMTLLFRNMSCALPTYDSAIMGTATVMTICFLTAGYLIPPPDGKIWIQWIFYINPLGLGYGMVMVNEFMRIDLTCPDSSLIPAGPGYTSLAHQVCNLPGSVSGTRSITGLNYIWTTFHFRQSDLWRNFGILLGIIIFLFIVNIVIADVFFGVQQKRPSLSFVKPVSHSSNKIDQLPTHNPRPLPSPSENGIMGKSLTWENLSYDIKTSRGKRRLLHNLYGYVKPGQLVALMGASGSGKTTLLDVLAQYKNIGVISGDVFVGSKPVDSSFRRLMGYAEQMDVHQPTQSVREALKFSADLRQSLATSEEAKVAHVEYVIRLLELEGIANAIIGTVDNGLNLEQRKMLTIGVELAAKPDVLLFLDEPTSGLDSQAAYNIVRTLRRLSRAGQAVLCIVHQPSSTLFNNFDRLILLRPGGRYVYFGDVGPWGQSVLQYFEEHGEACPPDTNPADWLLTTIATSRQTANGKDWAAIWSSSSNAAQVRAEISSIRQSPTTPLTNTSSKGKETAWAVSFWQQMTKVHRRAHRAFWRSPRYILTKFYLHAAISILIGLVFLNLGHSRTSVQDRVFLVFQVSVIPTILLTHVEPRYHAARSIFIREKASKMYGPVTFASSMVIAEMPYSIVAAVIFYLPLYYMPGSSTEPSRAGYQFLMILITELFAVTLGQAIAALTPTEVVSALLNPFIVVTMNLFCGATVPGPQMPAFYRSWLYPANPARRLISGMSVTELHGLRVTCTPREYIRFSSPPGQSCGDYMSAFFAAGSAGYLAQNDTSSCQYCSYATGDQFLDTLSFHFSERWKDLGIYAGFIGTNLILVFAGAILFMYNRR